ncbi:VC0807 family protein [Metabacillus sp. FJAT-52054]|uniref:VC0807 family protein n=1 Tax=Metabacillus sediminis TaxID=3117746 RepID=A0ABZ2NGG4_9BACI
MKKHLIISDILFYLVLPYVIWEYGKAPLGDYWAMLLSTVPGIIYTVFRFFAEKQFNVTGLFIMASLSINTIIDLLSQNAERMQQNNVWVSVGFGLFWIATILTKKPFGLYLMVDIAYLQGQKREDSLKLYKQPKLLPLFYLVSFVFAMQNLLNAALRAFLLNQYGIAQYDKILFFMKIYGWVFTVILMITFVFVGMRINDASPDDSDDRNQSIV